MPEDYNPSVFLELFLRPSEKVHFAEWKERIIDRSFVNRAFSPVFAWLASFVPDTVAPNVLTLSGSFAVIQAWYFCENYEEFHPKIVTVVSTVSIGLFWLFGGIDGSHALRTMNDTSLGELFKYVCDLCSSVFLIVVLCEILFEHDLDVQWYCVQTVQLVLMMKHYSAFVREAGLRYILVGPGELITWAILALVVRGVFGFGWLHWLYDNTWGYGCRTFVETLNLDRDGYIATMSPSRAIYLFVFYLMLCRILVLRDRTWPKHRWTRNMLTLILLLRGLSGFFRIDILVQVKMTSKRDLILDGLFMAMVSSDLIVAKMSGRELHMWVVLMATMVVVPHVQFLTLCFVVFYYIAVFGDLANHMNMPLLQVCVNVYCDGVYDLCHIGHKNMFHKALNLGNRLFVGVVGDEDALTYKRPPIMTAHEREAEVTSCKCVTKVISNAPCFGLTDDFLRRHRIHVVAFGQEYVDRFPDPKDDPYYRVPRERGIARALSRTEGLSTSELIKRIQSRALDAKKTPGE